MNDKSAVAGQHRFVRRAVLRERHMRNLNSRKAIHVAGVLFRFAGAAGPMHLFDDHMPVADKLDF
jgi:hypothetical protein